MILVLNLYSRQCKGNLLRSIFTSVNQESHTSSQKLDFNSVKYAQNMQELLSRLFFFNLLFWIRKSLAAGSTFAFLVINAFSDFLFELTLLFNLEGQFLIREKIGISLTSVDTRLKLFDSWSVV